MQPQQKPEAEANTQVWKTATAAATLPQAGSGGLSAFAGLQGTDSSSPFHPKNGWDLAQERISPPTLKSRAFRGLCFWEKEEKNIF